MIDRIKLNACYVVIVMLLALLVWSGLNNYWSGQTIDNHETTINLLSAEKSTLKATVSLQNAEIDRLEGESFKAYQAAEKAREKSIPVIEAEERRILGIRSAPKAQSYDDIRTKMLQDAML
ncbi:MAG TPA: hypothetical protein VN030_13800 [Cellvibrio sp.]|nr:hypothetical protein [Cellvibrio sp.]